MSASVNELLVRKDCVGCNIRLKLNAAWPAPIRWIMYSSNITGSQSNQLASASGFSSIPVPPLASQPEFLKLGLKRRLMEACSSNQQGMHAHKKSGMPVYDIAEPRNPNP